MTRSREAELAAMLRRMVSDPSGTRNVAKALLSTIEEQQAKEKQFLSIYDLVVGTMYMHIPYKDVRHPFVLRKVEKDVLLGPMFFKGYWQDWMIEYEDPENTKLRRPTEGDPTLENLPALP